MNGECPMCGHWPPPQFMEVPQGPDMVEHYSYHTLAKGTHQMEAFFSALLDGRVTVVPDHRGAFHVHVAPAVQDERVQEKNPDQQSIDGVE